jgi:hypothetical protein
LNANWSDIGEPDKPANNTSTFGLIILGLGVALAGWIVTIIYRLITGDGTREIVANLIPMESIDITIKTLSEVMIDPETFFT